jgi:NAD(P)-dependent dehydrogenase (short-subunit alcohol dehydrogenase family)
VSSGIAVNPRAYWGCYAVSKAALGALARTYAHEVENTAVRVNLVNPGPTRTKMRAQAYPGEDPASLKAPEDVVETFVRLAEPSCTDNGRLFDLKSGDVR